MKGITSGTWSEALNEIKLKIKELFKKHTNLIESLDKYDIEDFERYILKNAELNETDLKKSLRFLTTLLYKYYKQKVVVLIDEYDSPILSAFEKFFLKLSMVMYLKLMSIYRWGYLQELLELHKLGFFLT